MRKQHYLLVLLAWLIAFGAGAQINISGRVSLFGPFPDGQGIPYGFAEVLIQPVNSGVAAFTVVTDVEGLYTFTFPGNLPANPTWVVSVQDPCTGTVSATSFQSIAGQSDYVANFVVCEGITPPPPPEGCAAYFYWEQTFIDSTYTLQFFDVSYAEAGGITSWSWDFGDGATSTEQNPVHTYAEPGEYPVVLTIEGEDCTQTIVQIVTVTELEFCACPQIYVPVCVDTPAGQQITFPNACYAECAGYTDAEYASCEGNECGCPEFFAPVCVMLPDSTIRQFDNACFAACEGYDADTWVPCDGGCPCPTVYDPVCVATPGGIILTFGNACEAECAGYGPDIYYPCDGNGGCECPEIYAPVCVAMPDSSIVEFVNACFAECAGFGADSFVPCDGGCVCPDVWDPVCVQTNGQVLTFGNACEAECAGYGPDVYYPCDGGGGCVCPQIYAPVCVATPAGVITFTNACYAECEGFTEADYTPCDWAGCYVDFTFTFPNADDHLTLLFTSTLLAADSITAWTWDFGDGNTSTEATPAHTYAEGGVYEVTLTVESAECGTVSNVLHICIGDEGGFGTPNCQAFFFFTQPDPENLLTFQFIELPLGEAETLFWDFGDGNTSNEPNPLHTYATAGTYNVTLTVTAGECTSTVFIPVQTGDNVWYGDEGCRAWFLPIINPGSSQVYFVNLSSADAIEFAWDFGDGATSTDPLALHTYAEPGTYTATLTITSASGCINVFSATIDVAGGGFTGNPVFALISGTEEPTQLTALTVAPNPTRDVALVSWQPTQAGGYTWQLSDLSGRRVADGKGQATTGLETLDVDMRALPAGLYLFRLQTADGWQTMRLSKL